MKNTETPQLSQIIMVLQNINDNLRGINATVDTINEKLNATDSTEPKTIKHIVLLKQQDKSKKETHE